MGSLRSMAKDIMPPGMVPDEEYEDMPDDESMFDPGTIDTAAATTRGSDVPLAPHAGLGMNPDAGHSTVVIRALPRGEDAPSLMTDTGSDETAETRAPVTPSQSVESVGAQVADAAEPPPAYTGSVRASRRASYAARQNTGTGTVLGAADIGNGVDTIRPVKKVDTVRSLRLSEEYVGSLRNREREGSASSSPSPSPQSTKGSHKRAASEAQRAGKSLVDEVILPLIQKVRAFSYVKPACAWSEHD